MTFIKRAGCAALLAAAVTSTAAAESVGDGIAAALEGGNFDLSFRYRYELVDQDYPRFIGDPVAGQANASTLRTRLVYQSAEYQNIFLTLNMDDLRPVVGSDFNDTRNGKSQYPTVADPKGTDLNLASLTFTGWEGNTVALGRQRIIRENARFVGNVGWRQNEQTYDSVSVDVAATDKLQVYYAFVNQVKRVFGPDDGTPQAEFKGDSHLLDAAYSFSPTLRLVGYGYWLDLSDAPASSSQTVGVRATGVVGESPKISYTAEYASQQDYKDNPVSYSEGYYHLVAGADWAWYGFKAGYEVLEGDGTVGHAFQTPLATLHKFNGLADQFLITPTGGLQDAYIEATATGWGGKYSLTYHEFSQDSGNTDYGTEVDFIATWAIAKQYSLLAGIAAFDSKDGYLSDVNKVWLMLSADF